MKEHVSLEVAKKLQKVGYKSDCDYKYVLHHPGEIYTLERVNGNLQCPSAPTATQLGNELPSKLVRNMKEVFLYIWKDDANMWRVVYEKWGHILVNIDDYHPKQPTLSDALGEMMVYLLENKLI